MRAGGELKCPAGMVLKSTGGGGPHPDEPDYCIDITEVDQQSTEPFLAQRAQSCYELVVTKKDGSTERIQIPPDEDVEEAVSTIARRSDVARVVSGRVEDVAEVVRGRVASFARPETPGNLKGPRKPAIYFTYDEARTYCRWKYHGGDLPTNRQWERACGDKEYCKASEGNHNETSFASSGSKGPVDVDSYALNANGVKNMRSNVRERTRDLSYSNMNITRGGSWGSFSEWSFTINAPDGRFHFGVSTHGRFHQVGFRCVAPPQEIPIQETSKK